MRVPRLLHSNFASHWRANSKRHATALVISSARLLLTVVLLVVPVLNLSAAESNLYTLAAGDEISITVFNEPDLSLNRVMISANGSVAMPLLGQVDVHNLTVEEVQQKLTALLLDGYLKKPNVTVTITQYRPFYINGQIRSPGSYPFREGLTVEQAVTVAGGFTERASKSKISLVRQGDAADKRLVSLSDQIQPGDVITVDESFF